MHTNPSLHPRRSAHRGSKIFRRSLRPFRCYRIGNVRGSCRCEPWSQVSQTVRGRERRGKQVSRETSLLAKPEVLDRPRGSYTCRFSVPGRRVPIETWGQMLGRGLVPRLSIGTLQLSIRCSSIHFFPSRSLPVSTLGRFKGWVAAFGVGGSPVAGLSLAAAGKVRKIADNETSNCLHGCRMDDLADLRARYDANRKRAY